MPEIQLDQAHGRTARELVHAKLTATDAAASVGEVRAFFAASTSRRLAVLADGGRFAGVLAPGDVAEGDPEAPARERARPGPTIAADAPGEAARAAALADASRRVPVVEADGTLVGVVAIDQAQRYFCGTG